MKTYDMTSAERSLAIALSADLNLVEQAVKDVISFVESHGIAIEKFPFKLALYEGLSNAVRHGARGNAELIVRLLVELQDACVQVAISDPGDGFDWRAAIRNAKAAPPDLDSGRGIFLLKSYQCHPTYNDKGNVLTIRMDLR